MIPEKVLRFKGMAISIMLLCGLVMLFSEAILNFRTNVRTETVSSAAVTIGGEEYADSLPLSVKNLPHGTAAEVSFRTAAAPGKCLFFSAVYSPLQIYVNGTLICEYGQKDSYPSFMKDPPLQYASVLLPDDSDTLDITMTYLSPQERRTLTIYEPLLGTHEAILHDLVSRCGFSLIISLFSLFFGLMIALVSTVFIFKHFEKIGFAILYPGMFMMFESGWQLGHNTLAIYLAQNAVLMYFIHFIGMFILMIPLYRMGILYMNKRGTPFPETILFLLESSALLALLLQLTGIMSLHRTLIMYLFLANVSLLLFCIYTFCISFRYNIRSGKLFLPPVLVLSAAAILELINYFIHLTPGNGRIFQIGVYVFEVIMLAISICYISELLSVQRKQAELESSLRIRDHVLEFQKSRLETLISMSDEIRKQRHDLRHHLHTIEDLLEKEQYSDARAYIGTVTDTVPAYSLKIWCDNSVVNSTISYYANLAETEEIKLDIAVQVPKFNPNISDSNLCVIFGNLMENAIEACRLMKPESRCIKLYSRVAGEMLFISMDNSFNGVVHNQNGEYLSSKHTGPGTGLRSIHSLTELHGGSAEFTTTENRFRSEVCVKL